MTGFRIAKGCAQEHFGILPDLTTVRSHYFIALMTMPSTKHTGTPQSICTELHI